MKNSIIYLLFFSFMLAGCYTTEQYSDTPQNIISGKSKIELNDDFVLNGLTLKDKKEMSFKDCYSFFADCNAEGCSKLAVRKLIRLTDENSLDFFELSGVKYKKTMIDTIDVGKISLMHYSKEHFNQVPFAVAGILALVVAVFLLSAFPMKGKIN